MTAPEFPQNLTWINSEPLTMAGLRGRPVLIDFWTYSCVNCQRTQPYLNQWHEMYASAGLVIIGVHTPEFEFEKEPKNVRMAVKKEGIRYPVVMDSDYQIWNLYANQYWPRKFLINREGRIVYDHIGEGAYEETERNIRDVLGLPPGELASDDETKRAEGRVCHPTTPETYLGYIRGRLANAPARFHDIETLFVDASNEHDQDRVYAKGRWTVHGEHIESSQDPDAELNMEFRAAEVNLVIRSWAPAVLEIRLNGRPVPARVRGEDVTESNGRTVISVTEPRMYRLISSGTHLRERLTIHPLGAGIQLYAVTFGGCA